MLNSMWGKFGQLLDKTQVQTFDDPKPSTVSWIPTPWMSVTSPSSTNKWWKSTINIEKKTPCVTPSQHFRGLFLYHLGTSPSLQTPPTPGERVLHYDTNWVIYLEEPGQPNPPLGDYLGEFTSELDADDYIVEFVSGGPKNYGYITKKDKVECKVRGFRLSSEGKT